MNKIDTKKSQLIKRCLISDDALETYPFGRDEYKDTVVMRHKSNDKWFALIFYLEKKLYINLKCEPDIGVVVREQYPSVTPAWHMNKKHWIKADVENTSAEVLDELIKRSFDLTAPKNKKFKSLYQ